MSIKDILLAILLIFNVYFAYTVYGLNTESQETIVVEETDAKKLAPKATYDDYATLYMFKQIIPAEIFDEIILPEIESAFENGSLDKRELVNIKRKVHNLAESKDIKFSTLFLENMKQEDLSTAFEKMLDDMSKDVTNFGSSIKEDFKSFIDKHKDVFESEEESTTINTPDNGQKPAKQNSNGVTL